jgi:uncharacterized protein YkwD
MKLSGRAILLSITLAAGCVNATQRGAQPSEGNQANLKDESQQLFALANQARAQAKARRLRWDPSLAAAALKHCLRLVEAGPIGGLSHQYDGEPGLGIRAQQAGAHFDMIEENVASGGPTASAIHDAWMESPEHRENLLNPGVDCVGIAVMADDGVLYAVADYSHFGMRRGMNESMPAGECTDF